MSKSTSTQRDVVPLREKFFCDGAYYVLTSSTLAGSDAETVASKVSMGGEDGVRELLQESVCIPIAFPGDCAMDNAVIVMGDLTAEEEAEWIGRISWQLNIPCGKLVVVCGGGDAQSLGCALSGEGLGGFCDYFQQLEVKPGRYKVDVLAYLPSTTGNFYLESDEPMSEWQTWFKTDRKGEPLPEWLETFDEYTMPGELSDQLVSYIIQLRPLDKEPTSLPSLDEEFGWCAFEMRRPSPCPKGIERSSILS